MVSASQADRCLPGLKMLIVDLGPTQAVFDVLLPLTWAPHEQHLMFSSSDPVPLLCLPLRLCPPPLLESGLHSPVASDHFPHIEASALLQAASHV